MTDRNLNKTACRLMPLFLVCVLMMLSGCATLDQDECANADWHGIGFEDGARGYKASRIGDHRRACAKYGVAPDLGAYERGRQEGLEQWCTPFNGYRLGSRGKNYNGVCPKELEPAYIQALHQGKAVFDYGRQIAQEEQRLKRMHIDLDGYDKAVADAENELVGDDVSPRRRKKLLQEIRTLEKDRRRLLRDINDQAHTISQMQDNLTQMKAQNPYQ